MKVHSVTFVLTFSLGLWKPVETTDLSQTYFTDAEFVCNDNTSNTNITYDNIVKSNYVWLLPNGHVMNARQSTFDGSRIYMTFGENSSVLIVKKIDDEDFGVYWCVTVLNDSTIRVFRHSLNIDGVPMEEYNRQLIKNVIVGSISAGVLLFICLMCYVIWYFRCSERVRRKRNLVEELEKGINNYDTRIYDNVGMELYEKKC